MKVNLGTVEVTDEHRRLIGERLGLDIATRDQVRRFVVDNGVLALDTLQHEVDVLNDLYKD